MASMFARSSRSKDEDALRKDHKKRKVGHQMDEPRPDTGGMVDLIEENKRKLFETRPGAKATRKDIYLPVESPKKKKK